MSESTSGDPDKTGCNGLDFSSLLQQAVADKMSTEDDVDHSITQHNSNRLRGVLENSVDKICPVLERPEELPAFKHTKDQLEGRFAALENQINAVEQTGISAMDEIGAKMASMREEIVSEFQTRMNAMQNQIVTELAGFMVKVNRSLGEMVHIQAAQPQQQSSGSSKVPESPKILRNSDGRAEGEVSVTRRASQETRIYNSDMTESLCSKESPAKSPELLLDESLSWNEDVPNPHMDTDDNDHHQERQSSSARRISDDHVWGTKRVFDEESSGEASNIRKRRLTKSPSIELLDAPITLQIAPQQAHQDHPDSTIVAMQQRPIATKIFENLSQADLLNCSLVCKDWNVHAREVLRLKKSCLMYIDFNRNSYTDLENLSKTLWGSRCLPYWGISVTCFKNFKKQTQPTSRKTNAEKRNIWKMFEKAVVAKLGNLRCIRVDYTTGYDKIVTVGIENVCKRVADTLEILELYGKPPAVSKLLDDTNPFCNFSNLKNLKTPDFKYVKSQLYCLSVLAPTAPNLKIIDGWANPWCIEHPVFNDLMNRGLIKQFGTWFGPNTMNQCDQFAQMNLKLDELALTYLGKKAGCPNLKQWNRLGPSVRIAKHLLVTSSETLTRLQISLQDLDALNDMNDFPACPQLKLLCLNLRLENSNGLLRGLDLAEIFPKVETVWINYGSRADRNRNKFQDLGQYCGSLALVSKLTLRLNSGYKSVDKEEVRAMVSSFAHLCPNVKHLYAYGHSARHVRILLETLWSVWPDLETISIDDIRVSQLSPSFDSAICGITESEAKILRNVTSEIDAIDVTPMLPSIVDKAKLQKLRLGIYPDVSSTENENIGERVLTRLSGVLAFQRMPKLTIELYHFYEKQDCPFDLAHLKSFVKIESYYRSLVEPFPFPDDNIKDSEPP